VQLECIAGHLAASLTRYPASDRLMPSGSSEQFLVDERVVAAVDAASSNHSHQAHSYTSRPRIPAAQLAHRLASRRMVGICVSLGQSCSRPYCRNAIGPSSLAECRNPGVTTRDSGLSECIETVWVLYDLQCQVLQHLFLRVRWRKLHHLLRIALSETI